METIVRACVAILVTGGLLLLIYNFVYTEPNYLLPSWAIKLEPKDLIQAENSARLTLVQTIGGLGLLVSMFFTWRTMRATVLNVELSADKQLTELFSKAIDQLASKDLTVRIGGIFALGRIARQSPKDHWPIMQILTTRIKEISPYHQQGSQTFLSGGLLFRTCGIWEENQSVPWPTPELEAIVEVLRLRNSVYETEGQRLNLEGLNLKGMNFSGANLRGARFGGANLRGAKLYKAHLDDADFTGSNLCGADLSEAHLNRTNLIGADLQQAILIGADLNGALIHNVNLRGASLVECKSLQGSLERV